jgi:hypothetical protein
LFPKLRTNGSNFEFQIFDDKQELVYKRKNFKVADGQALINNIQNVVFGRNYRLVLLKPYYLPRQTKIVFTRGVNIAKLKSMFPLDFNRDGKWTGDDLKTLFSHLDLLYYLIP